ncbi:MAG: aminotransferase class III-fold pyridoxal phosphate-dependent enzyme [Kiloniellales bacterium]|nr:aminotransferase class III-fold pyridoxal phosphate-dependent enzyme [Kiloniellales bacterium]
MTSARSANDTSEKSKTSSQDETFALADKNLPGAGLGGYALPKDVRFIIKRGQGSRIETMEGRWYIDYVGGAGANILGHAHPEVTEAVQEQATKGLHFFGALNDVAVALSERLASLIPCAERIAYSTTGSEATFYAMRIARAFTGRSKILKFEGAYHGNHDYSSFSLFPTQPANYPVAPSDSAGVPDVLQPLVLVAPYNDLEATRKIVEEHNDDLAAIIVEGCQRIIMAKPEFLQGLRDLSDETGAVMIMDEVVTGFRLALGGAQEYFGVTPDLATYGKIVGGGGPIACVAGKAEILDCVNPARRGESSYTYINGTLHGNPVAAAAGLKTLEILERPEFYETLNAKSAELLKALQEVLDKNGVPAIAAGRNSFWQFLFMDKEPSNQVDIMKSDVAAMRRLDLEFLRRGCYVLPGVRRFVSAVGGPEDLSESIEALEGACEAIAA